PALLEGEAARQHADRGQDGDRGLSRRPHCAEFVDSEERDADDENDNAEFVEPVSADGFLKRRNLPDFLNKRSPRSRIAQRHRARCGYPGGARLENWRWRVKFWLDDGRLYRRRWRDGDVRP